jgi:hypothetical protein
MAKKPTKSGKAARKPGTPAKGAAKHTERMCEEEIEAGADFAAPTRTTPLREKTGGFSRVGAKGAVKPFAAQGVNSELPNAERCRLTKDDIHAPMARTSERTRRNVR